MANPTWFLVIQSIQASVAIIGGGIAAYYAISSAKQSLAERSIEQKWRKSNLAREMIADMEGDPATLAVYNAIDLDQTKIKHDGKEIILDSSIIEKAISSDGENLSDDVILIREVFDRFFVRLEHFEHAINRELVDFQDLVHYFHYYLYQMSQLEHILEYLKAFHFTLAVDFITRFKNIAQS